MSTLCGDLLKLILREHLGDNVEKVAGALFASGPISFRTIASLLPNMSKQSVSKGF